MLRPGRPLVGRSEYARFGKLVGADLVEQPDLALDPAVAADPGLRLHAEGVPKAAAEDDWVKVRRLIHGDLSGWEAVQRDPDPAAEALPQNQDPEGCARTAGMAIGPDSAAGDGLVRRSIYARQSSRSPGWNAVWTRAPTSSPRRISGA